jgi:hypothetical protein
MDSDVGIGRARYWFCRTAFGLLAVGLALLCIHDAVFLLQIFGFARALGPVQRNPGWFWLVNAPIPWTTFIGSLCLWGLWRVPFWQKRVLPLAVLNGIDAATWLLDHAEELGGEVPEAFRRHDWLVHVATMGFGWVELLLAASLATAVRLHLGDRKAAQSGRAAQLACALGLGVWALYALSQTDWTRWPLVRARIDMVTLLLILNVHAIQVAATFQVALLCMAAARCCTLYVDSWARYEAANDLLKSRSEIEEEIDLISPGRDHQGWEPYPNDSPGDGKRPF